MGGQTGWMRSGKARYARKRGIIGEEW